MVGLGERERDIKRGEESGRCKCEQVELDMLRGTKAGGRRDDKGSGGDDASDEEVTGAPEFNEFVACVIECSEANSKRR
jgi:hypothetical protein